MSSTKRGGQRHAYDFYPTPAWCVHRLLDAVGHTLSVRRPWIEPCVGTGALVSAVDTWCEAHWALTPTWALCDIEPQLPADVPCVKGDYTSEGVSFVKYNAIVAITNPPFALAIEFTEKMVQEAEHTLVLQRLGWLAGEKRHAWWRQMSYDVYVLPNRPSFTSSTNDSADYAWFHFHADAEEKLRLLALTPLDERKAGTP